MVRLQVVLTDEEAAEIRKLAEAQNRSVSNFLRHTINAALGGSGAKND